MIQSIYNFLLEGSYAFIYQLSITFLIIKKWGSIKNFFGANERLSGDQDIHSNESPRLGGAIIFSSLLIMSFKSNHDIYALYSLVLIPIFLVSLSEDLYANVKPKIRIIAMVFSSLLFLIMFDYPIPIISIPIIGDLLSNTIFGSIFLIFCITIITNGFNLIDGSNGNAVLTGISISSVLALFSTINNDLILLSFLIFFITVLIFFALFNFPLGKIFLGDSGAYIVGFVTSTTCIIIFYNNPLFSSWNAILLLFYPAFEVLWSFLRKVLKGKSPFLPDRNHLHIIVFDYLVSKKLSTNYANNLVVVFLSPIVCLGPFFVFLNPFASISSVMMKLILCFLVYYFYYLFFLKLLRSADANYNN